MIGGGGWRGVCTGGPDDKSYCVNSSPPTPLIDVVRGHGGWRWSIVAVVISLVRAYYILLYIESNVH